MPLTVQDVLWGLALPAAVALVLAGVAWRGLRAGPGGGPFARGAAAAIAVTAGFLAGYWLLGLGPLLPTMDREWLPYAAVLALVPALIPCHSGRWCGVRVTSLLAVVPLAAWLLVPTWPDLEPSRGAYLLAWSLWALLLALGLLHVLRRREVRVGDESGARCADAIEVGGAAEAGDAAEAAERLQALGQIEVMGQIVWPLMMLITLAAASVLLALSGSLRFAQTTASAMAAVVGLSLAAWLSGRKVDWSGVGLVFTLLVCAALLTARVNSFSEIPTVSYLILPAAPWLGGWTLPRGVNVSVTRRLLIPVVVSLLVCSLALGLGLAAEFAGK